MHSNYTGWCITPLMAWGVYLAISLHKSELLDNTTYPQYLCTLVHVSGGCKLSLARLRLAQTTLNNWILTHMHSNYTGCCMCPVSAPHY